MGTASSAEPNESASGMWSYPDGLGRTVVADLIGYQVIASDGEIGHIDRATDEIEGAAIVVDTGFWIFGKKRMIPAGVIDRIDAEANSVQVNLSKDDIKQAPDYVEDAQNRQAVDLHRDDVTSYYSRWWR
ncbi:MAG: domain containing protein [Ilumatobacteraceae bacterium]|nr:domain containing protein [Ilumatobacteraceae bacterium]